MCLSVMVRAWATLDFMLPQAENSLRRIGSRAGFHGVLQGCEHRPVWQEGIGDWVCHRDPPEAGHSLQVRWVGE